LAGIALRACRATAAGSRGPVKDWATAADNLA
jgi:hypothetical protein